MEKEVARRRVIPDGAVFAEWRAPDDWICRRLDWLQPAGTRARGNILFAGGRGDFVEKYLEIYAWWHVSGWNVTAFDWRGQGRSRGPAGGGSPTSFELWIDDLAELIADLRAEREGPHAAVAHSMGGHLLLRTLIERKPALDAAVLVAPMLRVNSAPLSPSLAPFITDLMCLFGWRNEPLWKAADDQLVPGSKRQRILTSCPDRYADELWWWEQHPDLRLGPPSWGWMRAAYRSEASSFIPAKLRQVEMPVLLIGTERDRLVSPAAIRSAAALLPNAAIKMYRDAGHEILREIDPIRLDALATIDTFLDEHAR